MSSPPSIDALVQRLREFRDARDWSKFHSAKNLAASVSIEAGELFEVFQWGSEKEQVTSEQKFKVRDEAADIFIYLLLLCDRLDIDLSLAALDKIERNEERFPATSAVGAKEGE